MIGRRGWPLLTLLLLAGLTGAAESAAAQETTSPDPQSSDIQVRITSPLGRTAIFGPVRIVAQVEAQNPIHLVRFYVNGELLGSDTDGAPFAVEWVDDNPFESREIVVDSQDILGNVGRDTLRLEPFEMQEVSGITSVLLEASVQDGSGRTVRGLDASTFVLTENEEPQIMDMVAEENVAATLAMLIDSSQSMSRRMGFVKQAARASRGFSDPRIK